MKKASILITSLNYEKFVGQTIECALNQTYPNVEVIVADDGSKDRSPDVIRGYLPRIKAVCKENGGQASAINAAWRLATGDVMFLLDSDDILKPTAVEQVMKAWKSSYTKMHFRLDVTDADMNPIGFSIPRARLSEGNLRSQVLEKGVYVSPPASGNAFSAEFLRSVMPIPENDWRFGAETHPVFLARSAPFTKRSAITGLTRAVSPPCKPRVLSRANCSVFCRSISISARRWKPMQPSSATPLLPALR